MKEFPIPRAQKATSYIRRAGIEFARAFPARSFAFIRATLTAQIIETYCALYSSIPNAITVADREKSIKKYDVGFHPSFGFPPTSAPPTKICCHIVSDSCTDVPIGRRRSVKFWERTERALAAGGRTRAGPCTWQPAKDVSIVYYMDRVSVEALRSIPVGCIDPVEGGVVGLAQTRPLGRSAASDELLGKCKREAAENQLQDGAPVRRSHPLIVKQLNRDSAYVKKVLYAPFVPYMSARTEQKLASAMMTHVEERSIRMKSACHSVQEIISDRWGLFSPRIVRDATGHDLGQYRDLLLRFTIKQMD
ncbi:hypothetical protein EVAR_94827_1 [Eumeta japonica]|uniref:Uncharacterized protein n=1 Tax=Eumeta variegata TaxID=151549 RepID=A0A4C1UI85_EUMVA|nr:hypothetical protein EVAR_94827_1 [Eumeta japonica]